MDIVNGAKRAVTRTAETATAALGAVGGAVVNGVIGGAQGTVTGAREGLEKGSQSTAAAGLTLAAVGATGLVAWPVLLGVGGTAFAVHLLTRSATGNSDDTSEPAAKASAPRKKPAPKTTR